MSVLEYGKLFVCDIVHWKLVAALGRADIILILKEKWLWENRLC